MIRWHGTITGTGLAPSALPTARAARGWPTRRARAAYESTSPNGMRTASASTRAWKSATPARSTATVKNVRRPARYSRSSCRARSAWARARADAPWLPRPGRSRATPRSVASILNLSASASRSTRFAREPPSSRDARSRRASGAKNSSSMTSMRSMALFLQRLFQDCLAPRELTLDRVDGDPSDRRELPVREAVHVVQREQHARLPGHAGERASEIHALHRMARPPPGERLGRSPSASTQLVDADVREHAIEPRRYRPPRRVRLPRLEGLQQGPLNRVLGIGPTAKEPIGHRVEPYGVFFGGTGERALVHLVRLYAAQGVNGWKASAPVYYGPRTRGVPHDHHTTGLPDRQRRGCRAPSSQRRTGPATSRARPG